MACRNIAYHRAGSREPWLLALRRLHANGLSDREVAENLSALSAEAIERLEAGGSWHWRQVEAVTEPGASGLPWSRWQVAYYRRQLELPANRQRYEGGSLWALCRAKRLLQQREAGWLHVLPAYDEAARQWKPGIELKPRELEILGLLSRDGPLTGGEIAARLGHRGARPLRSGRVSYLKRLLDAGLILARALVRGSKRLLFALNPDYLHGGKRKRLATGAERLARDIACGRKRKAGRSLAGAQIS